MQYSNALKLYDESSLKCIDIISHSLAIKCCANNANCNILTIYSQLKKENKINYRNSHIQTVLINSFGRCHDVLKNTIILYVQSHLLHVRIDVHN